MSAWPSGAARSRDRIAGTTLAAVVVCFVLVGLLLPAGAIAARHPRPPARVSLPASVVAGARLRARVRLAAGAGRVTVELQRFERRRWRTQAAGHVRAGRATTLAFTAPSDAPRLRLRVVLIRAGRVLWRSPVRLVTVRPRTTQGHGGGPTAALVAPGGRAPSLALEPNGTAVLVYQVAQSGSSTNGTPTSGSVWAAVLAPGASAWSKPQQLWKGAVPIAASVSAGPDGTVLAAWTVATAAYPAAAENDLWSSVLSPGQSTFGAAVRVQAGDQRFSPGAPQPLLDGSGQQDIYWYNESVNDGEGYVQVRDPGGSWSAPETVGPAVTSEPASPVLAPSGESFAITDNGGNYEAVPHAYGGGWGDAETIWNFAAGPGITAFSPADPIAAASAAGTIAAVWSFTTGGQDQLESSVRSPAGTWSSPVALDSASDTFTYSYRIAADGLGHYTVLAPQQTASGVSLVAHTSDASGSNWTTSTLAPSLAANDWFNVASSADGNTAVLYDAPDTANGTARLFITLRPAGQGSWTAPMTLSSTAYGTVNSPGFTSNGLPYYTDFDPAVLATPSRALVVWQDVGSGGLRFAALPW